MRLRWLVLLGSAALCGCSRSAGPDCPPTEDAAPVDTDLLSYLSRARSAHHAADRHEQSGDVAAAVRVLEELALGARREEWTEAREITADTRARLADLESRRRRFEAAEEHVGSGLDLVPEASYFRGHLFEVRGLLEERRAEALRENGKSAEAERAADRALSAFEEAMRIQAGVIDQGLDKGQQR